MHIDFKSVRARLSRIASLGSQAEKLTNEVLAIVAESREGHVSLHEVEQAVEDAGELAGKIVGLETSLGKGEILPSEFDKAVEQVKNTIEAVKSGVPFTGSVAGIIADAEHFANSAGHNVGYVDGIKAANAGIHIIETPSGNTVFAHPDHPADGLLKNPLVESLVESAYDAGHADAIAKKLDAAGVVTKQDATDLVNAGRAAAKDAVIAAVQKVADDHSGAVVKGALNKALDAANAVSLIESALTDSDTSAPISPGAKGDAS